MAAIFHEKGFKFHAQPQIGAYLCLNFIRAIVTKIIWFQKISQILTFKQILKGSYPLYQQPRGLPSLKRGN